MKLILRVLITLVVPIIATVLAIWGVIAISKILFLAIWSKMHWERATVKLELLKVAIEAATRECDRIMAKTD